MIAAGNLASALAAKATTTTIPIVFAVGEDPVRFGLVVNLARPGSNLTGINFLNVDVTTKRHVTASTSAMIHRELLTTLAARNKLPAVYYDTVLGQGGGLMSYGPDFRDKFRRAAGYVDRILKGEKPADLPVQAPTKYELVINLKTAKALGLECRRRCSRAPTR